LIVTAPASDHLTLVAWSQKQAHEEAEKEQQGLQRTQQQALSSTLNSKRSVSNNRGAEIPGLGDWELTALKKNFLSHEEAKNRCQLGVLAPDRESPSD
jgi:hypothetical protein